MNPSQKEQKALNDAHEMTRFLSTRGGEMARDTIASLFDKYMLEMSSEKAPHSAEFYAGALDALTNVWTRIIGSISYGKLMQLTIERRARQEVEFAGRTDERTSGQPRSVPSRRRGAAAI